MFLSFILLTILIFGFINMIGTANTSYKKNGKNRKVKRNKKDHTGFKPYTQDWKDQHLKWASEGLCGECGKPSGDELGICDECSYS